MFNILHLSDTHSQHRRLTQLPDADILVHSGDFTMNGSEQEAIDFMNWFCDLSIRIRFSSVAITMPACIEPILMDWMRMCIICAILVW